MVWTSPSSRLPVLAKDKKEKRRDYYGIYPVIESYMVQLCTESRIVKEHPLYSWKYANKLWYSDKGEIKEKSGKRQISSFPKFSYVTEKVFGISSSHCIFYYSDKFQHLTGSGHFRNLNPYKGLKSFVDYN